MTFFDHSSLLQSSFQIYPYAIFGEYRESKVYLVQTVSGIAYLKNDETTYVTHEMLTWSV